MYKPERFGSHDQEHFNEAYDDRPLFNAIVKSFHGLVYLFAGLGIMALVSGWYFKGVGSLILAVVSFVYWAVFHNWALTHPK
ncbi:MAG TPA: hypothetical protein DCZ05_03875 [Deltaproteobacteria bacterium]|nr:hypothetical protein [Deltaproteobacteria bacterium]